MPQSQAVSASAPSAERVVDNRMCAYGCLPLLDWFIATSRSGVALAHPPSDSTTGVDDDADHLACDNCMATPNPDHSDLDMNLVGDWCDCEIIDDAILFIPAGATNRRPMPSADTKYPTPPRNLRSHADVRWTGVRHTSPEGPGL